MVVRWTAVQMGKNGVCLNRAETVVTLEAVCLDKQVA